jgi:hypothetical protein
MTQNLHIAYASLPYAFSLLQITYNAYCNVNTLLMAAILYYIVSRRKKFEHVQTRLNVSQIFSTHSWLILPQSKAVSSLIPG